MNTYSKIVVIGGAGKAGQFLVHELLNQGYFLHLLLRHPEKLPIQHANIRIIPGDVRDYEAVSQLVAGCDAIISTLGQPADEPVVFSEAEGNILRAMKAHRLQRYIVVTGLSIDLPSDQKSETTRMKTDWMKAKFPAVIADKQKEAQMLLESSVDWTLVRIPMLEQTDATGETVVSTKDCPGDAIRAADLARFLVSQLTDTQYSKQAPFVASL